MAAVAYACLLFADVIYHLSILVNIKLSFEVKNNATLSVLTCGPFFSSLMLGYLLVFLFYGI